MFGRKKKAQALVSTVDDSRSVVYDFRCRIPFESYRTDEYRLYHKLEEETMLPIIHAHLEKLFQGEVDDGNGNMLDNIIFGAAREARPDLGRQRYNHDDLLNRLITRRKADRADFEKIIMARKQELEDLERAYARTCYMAAKYNGEEAYV